ncbi:MAG: Hdr-like menaquinol oxidoreductase cytochrome c subunit [Phyllobacteriaceae bacterium]|nr:Hdr-like menaquinol oxidoreductase cytochrome c subunit [Phyllobacteriaceae bacterium]
MRNCASLAGILLFLVTLALGAVVGAATGWAIESSVPKPAIPQAAGQCLAPPDVMRRFHMVMLKHTRDVTVREGDRQTAKGLSACVTCHAVKDASGAVVSISSPRHFCRACHDYAAVKIDCFECHASRPLPEKSAAVPSGADVAALKAYAEETTR